VGAADTSKDEATGRGESGMSDHFEWHEILEALEASSERTALLAAHRQQCPDCERLAAAASRLLDLLKGARLEPVPADLAARTVARICGEATSSEETGTATWRQLLDELRAALEEIPSRLVADSLVPSNAWRGSDQTGPQTLRYETDTYSISLSMEPTAPDPDSAEALLRGQVVPLTGDTIPPVSRAILHQPDRLEEAQLDDLGEFSFRGIARAPLRLALVLGSGFVHMVPLAATPPGNLS